MLRARRRCLLIPLDGNGTLGGPTTLVDDARGAEARRPPVHRPGENQFLPVDCLLNGVATDFGRVIDGTQAQLSLG